MLSQMAKNFKNKRELGTSLHSCWLYRNETSAHGFAERGFSEHTIKIVLKQKTAEMQQIY